ncbi:MAG: Streptogramin A acetyltransferase [Syntrophus sp. PtaB.Bin138]|nr:MAG: Streptogramin A acetyltransferase [Syntrophus sp. PtaB.Bin138]
MDFIKRTARRTYYYYLKRQFKELGNSTKVNPTANINDKKLISIGHHSFIGKCCHISIVAPATLVIGNYVCISPYVKILGGDHNLSVAGKYFMTVYDGQNKPIVIEDDTLVGMDAMILKGVTIGEGAVVAARAVVTKNILPYTTAVGNPARMIKLRFSMDDLRVHLNALKSHYDIEELRKLYLGAGLLS